MYRVPSHITVLTLVAVAASCGDEQLGTVPPCAITSDDRTAFRELPSSSKLPFDVVVLVDNSPSMAQEINALESAINHTFANILDDTGVDFRVVVVSQHGSTESDGGVCIESPLSGTQCSPIPAQPANTSRFVHYSVPVGSHDGWCKLMRTYSGGAVDEFGLVDGGWQNVLRPEALKFFIEMTDDGVECRFLDGSFDDGDNLASGKAAAEAFDQTLLSLGRGKFGSAADRLYRWYSIVGFSSEGVTGPLRSDAPIVERKTANAMAPGTGSQALAALTGGLRFSIAQTGTFDAIFEAIAEHTIDTVINRVYGCE